MARVIGDGLSTHLELGLCSFITSLSRRTGKWGGGGVRSVEGGPRFGTLAGGELCSSRNQSCFMTFL